VPPDFGGLDPAQTGRLNFETEAACAASGFDLSGSASGPINPQPIQRSPMKKFIHEENLKLFRKRLAETTDPAERQMLLKLLAEEEAK
jgi:hypothetical protein